MSSPPPAAPTNGRPSDALEEYGGDCRTYEPLDGHTAAAIIRRRKRDVPTAGAVRPEEGAPSPAAAAPHSSPPPDGPIRLRSRGRALIVGWEPEAVKALGLRLAKDQPCLMLVEEAPSTGGPDAPAPAAGGQFNGLLRGRDVRIRGGLGRFEVFVRGGDRRRPLGEVFNGLPDHVDLVLDLRPQPPGGRILPPGYFAPDGDPDTLAATLDELPRMVGVFEKPRFVRLDPAQCAGPEACERCSKTCPTAALDHADGVLAIDHAACPGCGLCTLVCPTGALQYRHPSPQDLLAVVHGRLADARMTSGAPSDVIFSQGSPEGRAPESAAPATPQLHFPLVSVASAGPEVWLGALAFGARQVVVELPPGCPTAIRQAIDRERSWVAVLLSGLGHDPRRFQLRETGISDERLPNAPVDAPPATDVLPFQPKRELIRRSASHLAACGQAPDAVPLPEEAPFGAVEVNRASCTLCMACSGSCPTGALIADEAAPQLSLRESRCIQCGRCRAVCPEGALTMKPRLQWDADGAAEPRRLHAQAPMACIRCGRPFAPAALVERLQQRLEDHWMYRGEEDRRRLQMCRDCRVRDLFDRPLSKEEP